MKYFRGIIGAIIGAFIASLPWLLMYVYGGWIIALLALPIAIAAEFGYRKMKGEPTKHLALIIAIITVVVVLVQNFLIIPLFLLNKEGLPANLDMLKFLYQNSEFTSAMIKDGAISIFFAILGISGIYKKMKDSNDITITENETVIENETAEETEITDNETREKTEVTKKKKTLK